MPADARERVRQLPAGGSPERQLRGLLWALDVPSYNDPGLNLTELVERLEQKIPAAVEPKKE